MVSQEQRRKQLAREKFLRQQQRREAARRRRRMRNAVIAGAVALVVAGGAVSYAAGAFDDGGSTNDDAAPKPTPSKPEDPCRKAAPGKIKPLGFKKEPALTIDKSASYEMKLATTCGDIGVDLDAAKAPHTVNSFNFLVNKGYLDHTKCHRLTAGNVNVLQCGDPKGTGEGDPGYSLPDENLKDKRLRGNVYPAGTVAMANRYKPDTKKGRDTGGSQFFLVYQDSQLPPDYTPFGTISDSGMKVLKKIAAAGESSGQGDGTPNATVVIDKATVAKS
ncbi:peptidylprolyl isomerase [Streptomyces lasiicapitis]|uniref:Peptidyl-prolyl cis-trans isomerase n=1 Tax=Streptomyces lasiicapitis TaxID=1923961 RepID=A0ABQ2MEQ8_9ACTN|nr:peptidylprolyl isomerase [Streptomyces lasiicapitis]GGO51130.1 peptidyl-prolyl cis-trans isomerase [Streptomyces lasiicapitis]